MESREHAPPDAPACAACAAQARDVFAQVLPAKRAAVRRALDDVAALLDARPPRVQDAHAALHGIRAALFNAGAPDHLARVPAMAPLLARCPHMLDATADVWRAHYWDLCEPLERLCATHVATLYPAL